MTRSLLPESPINGGFPEPPADEPVRVVAARHAACGEATRVRLPSAVPARAVRRMCCSTCARPFEADRVEELGVESAGANGTVAAGAAASGATAEPRWRLPRPSLPDLDPESRFWRLASLPLAAVAVIVVLFLLQGGGSDDAEPTVATDPVPTTPATVEAGAPTDAGAADQAAAGSQAATEPGAADAANAAAAGNGEGSRFVSGSTYSLALPAGWKEVEPTGGATFAAEAPGGEADVSLWVTEDPKLDYPEFVNQSLRQLQALAGSRPEIAERIPGPDADSTIVRLAADAPEGEPTYEVTLRVNGPYRYYLATTIQPDAPADVVADTELIEGSFTPEAKG